VNNCRTITLFEAVERNSIERRLSAVNRKRSSRSIDFADKINIAACSHLQTIKGVNVNLSDREKEDERLDERRKVE
jgi:hypothetical protein